MVVHSDLPDGVTWDQAVLEIHEMIKKGSNVKMKKGLDESQLIELSGMVSFYEEDVKRLGVLMDSAGEGSKGRFERYKLTMTRYLLKQVIYYLESICDAWLEHKHKIEEAEESEDLTDIPMTIIEESGNVIRIDSKKNSTPKSTPQLPPSPISAPAYKNANTIRETITEIMSEVSSEDKNRPGFQGWLAAEITRRLGGKSDPAQVLEIMREAVK